MGLDKYACKRAYVTNDRIIKFIETKAKFVGKARFTDYVLLYSNLKEMNTDKNLLWCREIHENVWPTMKVGKYYPFYKKDIRFDCGFQFFSMPIGSPPKEFGRLVDAKKAFGEEVKEWFKFQRTTMEYMYNNISIYLEDVEFAGRSIEFVCRTESSTLKENMRAIDELMKEYEVKKIIPRQVATLVRMKLRR